MKKSWAILILLFFAFSCKQNYDIPLSAVAADLLVVEGYLTSSAQGTTILLSKSVGGSAEFTRNPETGATVTVISEGGLVQPVDETADGRYSSPNLLFDESEKYKVRIQTKNGKTYESALLTYLQTPQIDSISWRRENGDIQIYANTHDSQNNTRYYRWDFDETFEFNSFFYSNYEYVNGSVIRRVVNNIFTCWRSGNSSNIFLGSSAKLTNDVISLAPILRIRNGEIRLSVRFSINVRQYGLTKDAFEYWDRLKKNTEQLGTIFDPQPSANKTNITCLTDPAEMVLGYVSAGDITSRRIFITNGEVQPWNYRAFCEEIAVPEDSVEHYFGLGIFIPTQEWSGAFTRLGYYASTRSCVDCTGLGTNIRPSFW